MRYQKALTIFIFCIAVLSIVLNLPSSYHIRFTVGSFKIDRVISSPKLDFNLGKFRVKKDFLPRFGLDLAGGARLVLEAEMDKISDKDKDNAFQSAKNVVERRINLYGLTEPIIQQSKVGGAYRLVVEIPSILNVNQAVDLIGKTAQLSFREESTASSKIATPSSYFDLWPKETALSGKNLKKSEVTFDPNSGKPVVSIEFDNEGSKLFEELTARNTGKTIAIFLDNDLLSAPRVNERITGGRAVIQGSFSFDDAKRLSIALNAGALPVSLKVIEQKNVGATLGKQSVEKSILAGMVGLSIVGLFMIVNYGFLGFVADVALIIYALIVLAMFHTIPVTLTLAGIAGFILSIGMAVDANILIFERIKEEIRWGKDKSSALHLGFDRAFPSIRDSNASSLLTCLVLYYFGTGIVRGFAVTLAVGIIVSLFSAITVTRTLLRLVYRS